MSDTVITNKIKPTSGKTIEVEGNLVVDDIQVNNQTDSSSLIPLPAGSIIPFAGRKVPTGFLLCDGKEISRSEYPNLFEALGEEWGEGNGSTTFNIPDLRGAFLRGAGLHGTMKKANGNAFSGPRVGNFEDDQIQAHLHTSEHPIWWQDFVNPTNDMGANDVESTLYPLEYSMNGYAVDGANGTPRTGDETKPFNAGVNYIIKI